MVVNLRDSPPPTPNWRGRRSAVVAIFSTHRPFLYSALLFFVGLCLTTRTATVRRRRSRRHIVHTCSAGDRPEQIYCPMGGAVTCRWGVTPLRHKWTKSRIFCTNERLLAYMLTTNFFRAYSSEVFYPASSWIDQPASLPDPVQHHHHVISRSDSGENEERSHRQTYDDKNVYLRSFGTIIFTSAIRRENKYPMYSIAVLFFLAGPVLPDPLDQNINAKRKLWGGCRARSWINEIFSRATSN